MALEEMAFENVVGWIDGRQMPAYKLTYELSAQVC